MTHEQECIIEELENICINNEYVLELLAKLKNEERPQGDLISRSALKKHKFTTQVYNGVEPEDIEVVGVATIDNAPPVERLQGEWIPVKDLNNFIRTCREELFEKMNDYHPREFEIRDNMLLNFEQIVKLASSKYDADMRGAENEI